MNRSCSWYVCWIIYFFYKIWIPIIKRGFIRHSRKAIAGEFYARRWKRVHYCILNTINDAPLIYQRFTWINIFWCDFISDALNLYKDRLSTYEHSEILEYQEVWYLGLDAKKLDAFPGKSSNNGYDDENGSYLKVHSFHNTLQHLLNETSKIQTNICIFTVFFCFIIVSADIFGLPQMLNPTGNIFLINCFDILCHGFLKP